MIERQEASNCVLMKVNSNEETFDPVHMAYIELDRKVLENWLELKDKADELKPLGARELTLYARMWWIEEIPEELEELFEYLPDEEHIEVTKIPEDFLKENEMRVDGSEATLSEWGVGFKTIIKYTNAAIYTWSFSWDFIEQALKNCDPQSVRFIKDTEEA